MKPSTIRIPTPERLARIAKATRRCHILSALDELDSGNSTLPMGSRLETRVALEWELALLNGVDAPKQVQVTDGATARSFPRIWRVLVCTHYYRDGKAHAFRYY